MNSVFIPFLMSMFLGRTIDLTTYTIGGGIYDNTLYDETEVHTFNTTYTVLQENAFPYAYFGLPVDIALRIKTNLLSSSSGIMGLDGLLKETSWKQRSAVVAVASNVFTIKRTLKKDAPLLTNWASRISDDQTHYANSLFYGGWSLILYRFKCDIPGDADIVRNTITSTMGVHGKLEPDTMRLFKTAMSVINKNPEIRGKVTVDTLTYSTFPFKHNLTSPNGLLRVINTIPKLVGSVGKPMFTELLPLHELDKKFPVVEEKHELDKQLEEIAEMYDDVKNTKNSLTRWYKKSEKTFTEKEETRISKLLSHLNDCIKLFYKVANEASVYKVMSPELLKSAVLLYTHKLQLSADTYDRVFRRLKEEVDADCENSFLHKIKGLLQVVDSERILVGKVQGGLKECEIACLAVPNCRSIGYIERILEVKKDKDSVPPVYKLVFKEKQCYIYFRSSSTANVIAPKGAGVTGVYDRKCN